MTEFFSLRTALPPPTCDEARTKCAGVPPSPAPFQAAPAITPLPSGRLPTSLRRNGPQLYAPSACPVDSSLAPQLPCLLLFYHTLASPLDSEFSQGVATLPIPPGLPQLRPDHVNAHGPTPTLPLRFPLKLQRPLCPHQVQARAPGNGRRRASSPQPIGDGSCYERIPLLGWPESRSTSQSPLGTWFQSPTLVARWTMPLPCPRI